MTTRTILGYQVIDCHTGVKLGKQYAADKGRAARAAAEKRNQAYGAHRYTAQPVWSVTAEVSP